MSFSRIKQRTDTYANWENQNNNTPGGLKIMQGEICVVLADSASAAAGLSNIIADTVTPLVERLANTGEVLGTKVGQGFAVRWDEIPLNFHLPNINFPNGGGRILGTRSNGASHVYNHPGKALKAVFAPVYSAPEVGLRILTGAGTDLNNALLEVGQPLEGVHLAVYPYLRTYRIKVGRAFETTFNPAVQIGLDETAIDPNTIGNFSRLITAAPALFAVTPQNATYDGGQGYYTRRFYSDVLDDRPAVEGGNVRAGSGEVRVSSAYPMFFGKSNLDLPASEVERGIFLQEHCTSMIRPRSNYDAGKVAYRNGERAHLAYPEAWGPLSVIRDVLGVDTMAASFNAPVRALISKNDRYTNIPYLVYRLKTPATTLTSCFPSFSNCFSAFYSN